MTTSIIPPFNDYTVTKQDQDRSSYCTLQWRRNQLLVKAPGQVMQPYLLSLDKEEFLVKCLEHSSVNLVRIDPKLGEDWVKVWANACEQTSKPIFLRIPSAEQVSKQGSLWRFLQRLVDWIVALVFLLAVSPVMLILVLLMSFYSPGTFFEHEWRVGKRGKLFRAIKFRTTSKGLSETGQKENITPLGHWMRKCNIRPGYWMRKCNIDNLPRLFNVLQGEMSLVGHRCWTLEEAVRLSSEKQQELNKLPGITGYWEVKTEGKQFHLDSQAS